MRVSLSITQFPTSAEHTPLDRIVRVADEGGIDTVWVADHLAQYAPGTNRPTRTSRPTRRWAGSRAAAGGCGWARWSARSRFGRPLS
jgi:alkanesulfonate monooxygenase SsuD/methylene tetrahydromethanopterin reductase-like flavin-dependent oxidoreductase (luciferase family)